MATKRSGNTKQISNRRASYDYNLDDGVLAGIVLTGAETKALRMNLGNLRGAYVTNKGSELWLTNATITGNSRVRIDEADYNRPRKLLLKKREIAKLLAEKDQGKTIIPLAILTKGRFIKIRIAAGKGKKHYDKRESIKKRESDRRNRQVLGRI